MWRLSYDGPVTSLADSATTAHRAAALARLPCRRASPSQPCRELPVEHRSGRLDAVGDLYYRLQVVPLVVPPLRNVVSRAMAYAPAPDVITRAQLGL